MPQFESLTNPEPKESFDFAPVYVQAWYVVVPDLRQHARGRRWQTKKERYHPEKIGFPVEIVRTRLPPDHDEYTMEPPEFNDDGTREPFNYISMPKAAQLVVQKNKPLRDVLSANLELTTVDMSRGAKEVFLEIYPEGGTDLVASPQSVHGTVGYEIYWSRFNWSRPFRGSDGLQQAIDAQQEHIDRTRQLKNPFINMTFLVHKK